MTWEFREHTADLRVAFAAASLEELFGDAVDLIGRLTAGDGRERITRERRPVALEADAPDELLLRFLRELLFLFETERFVPASLDAGRLDPTGIAATVGGEPFDPGRHETQPEVKAVTRHALRVTRSGSGWEAEVVFDL